jgi:hypothetical protein
MCLPRALCEPSAPLTEVPSTGRWPPTYDGPPLPRTLPWPHRQGGAVLGAHSRVAVGGGDVPACSPLGTIGSADGDIVGGPASPYTAVVVDTTAFIISAFFDIQLLSWTTRSPAVVHNVGSAAGATARRCEGHGFLLADVVTMVCFSPCRGNRPSYCSPSPSSRVAGPATRRCCRVISAACDAVAWAADGRAQRTSWFVWPSTHTRRVT